MVGGVLRRARGAVGGEVVFNTAMSGYVETLTDPSYGARSWYHVPARRQLRRPRAARAAGRSTRPTSRTRSRCRASSCRATSRRTATTPRRARSAPGSQGEGIPAVTGIDTRTLTRKLREHGTMKGWLFPAEMDLERAKRARPRGRDAARRSSASSRRRSPSATARRRRLTASCSSTPAPRTTSCARLLGAAARRRARALARAPRRARRRVRRHHARQRPRRPEGPRAPHRAGARAARRATRGPIFGICLGNQILALAAGGDTYKLPYGHRGVNQPVQDLAHAPLLRHEPEPRLRRARRVAAAPTGSPGSSTSTTAPTRASARARGPSSASSSTPRRAPGPRTRASSSTTSCASSARWRADGAARACTARTCPRSRSASSSSAPAALQIGQAGEFDYSGLAGDQGVQGGGRRTPSSSTPTSPPSRPARASPTRIYLTAVTPDFVERILVKEEVDAIALSFGGQTALNCGLALARRAASSTSYGVRVLGTPIKAIRDTEDRELFIERLAEIGVKTARSQRLPHRSPRRARPRCEIGLPGDAARRLRARRQGLAASSRPRPSSTPPSGARFDGGVPQVLVEEYLARLEGDRVRGRPRRARQLHHRLQHGEPRPDGHPHGRVASSSRPSQTLERRGVPAPPLASRSRRCATSASSASATSSTRSTRRARDYRVIEVNARLSRSSRARQQGDRLPARLRRRQDRPRLHAARDPERHHAAHHRLLRAGARLPGRARSRAGTSASSAAPTTRIGSEMKSVGEVMAIGRTFPEVIQKALRMLDIGVRGPRPGRLRASTTSRTSSSTPTPLRIFAVAQALRDGLTVDEIHELTQDRPLVLARHRARSSQTHEELQRRPRHPLDEGELLEREEARLLATR